MDESDFLAEQFEEHRSHLRAVAYRMLGSLTEADDAVQEGWLRLSRSDSSEVENLRAWLTTVVARVCLNVLRSRRTRRRGAARRPRARSDRQPRRTGRSPSTRRCWPTRSGWRCSSSSRRSTPAERLAFVLHDMFAVPFDRDRGPRRALAGGDPAAGQPRPPPGPGPGARCPTPTSRFSAASSRPSSRPRATATSRRLVAVLDPDVVSRADGGALRPEATAIVRGAREVAARALTFARLAPFVRPALVNGGAGVVVAPPGETVRRHGLHRGGREDRRDRLDHRSRAPARARPDRARRLTLRGRRAWRRRSRARPTPAARPARAGRRGGRPRARGRSRRRPRR